MSLRPCVALVLSLCGSAAAQNYTAYPIDALHGFFGHWTPFGILGGGSGGADESRSQHLIPAAFLPSTGSVLMGIEVSPHVTGTVPYVSLAIHAGHTTATTLSNTFATNLPSPQTVYSVSNHSIAWNSTAVWYPVTFQTPFIYDGTSNLVIEIQKVVDRANNPTLGTMSHQMSNLPMRSDLPHPLFRDGTAGSGASQAATGTIYSGPPLLMRLRWTTERTLTIDSTRGTTGDYFRLGATLGLHAQGMPGEAFVDLFDGGLAATPLALPPVVGWYWLPPRFLILGSGVIGASGVGDLLLTIPSQPELVGSHLYFQALVASVSALSWTNVVDAILAQ
jgi:hypothetical protein